MKTYSNILILVFLASSFLAGCSSTKQPPKINHGIILRNLIPDIPDLRVTEAWISPTDEDHIILYARITNEGTVPSSSNSASQLTIDGGSGGCWPVSTPSIAPGSSVIIFCNVSGIEAGEHLYIACPDGNETQLNGCLHQKYIFRETKISLKLN